MLGERSPKSPYEIQSFLVRMIISCCLCILRVKSSMIQLKRSEVLVLQTSVDDGPNPLWGRTGYSSWKTIFRFDFMVLSRGVRGTCSSCEQDFGLGLWPHGG